MTRTIAGKYELLDKLGEGGFGAVWRARELLLERDVALKLLRPEIAARAEVQKRFLREVKAAQAFVHRFAVQVRDFGRDDEQDCLYFTMDLVEGPSLRDVLRQAGRLAPARALNLAMQTLEVLDQAHLAGLVHRDLKPENLLVTTNRRGQEEIRVLDFGIAKAIRSAQEDTNPLGSELSQAGQVIGTINYMSPEQAQALQLDGRSDLYSLGVVLYEMLAGEVPFAPDPRAVNAFQNQVIQLLTKEPPSLVERGLSAEVEQVVFRALAKDPAQRWADAAEFSAALANLGAGLPQGAAPSGSASAAGTASYQATQGAAGTDSYQATLGGAAPTAAAGTDSYQATLGAAPAPSDTDSYQATLGAAPAGGGPDPALDEQRLRLIEQLQDAHQRNDSQAEESLARALLRIETLRYGEESLEALRTRATLADVVQRQGRTGEALELWRDLLEIRRRVQGDSSLEVAQAHVRVALAAEAEGDERQAAQHYVLALAGSNLLGAPRASVTALLQALVPLRRSLLGPERFERYNDAMLRASDGDSEAVRDQSFGAAHDAVREALPEDHALCLEVAAMRWPVSESDLERMERVAGRLHPLRQGAVLRRALWERESGRPSAAVKRLRELSDALDSDAQALPEVTRRRFWIRNALFGALL
ncbi:MAG TPA: hypothetical protein DEA08_30245, partial [Planctomycetes bacterium]|nr:hypothetical protein [Planctomycetota bacterium]